MTDYCSQDKYKDERRIFYFDESNCRRYLLVPRKEMSI